MFVFLLPYVCACLWGHVGVEKEALRPYRGNKTAQDEDVRYVNVDMAWGTWTIPMEEYLVYKLEMVMPGDYEAEALKAQAVLIRTEIVQIMQQEDTRILRVAGGGMEKWYGAGAEETEELLPYRQAVEDTDGLYLSYEGEPIQASYFKVSNGRTRDAGQVWQTDKLPYIKSVSCDQDKAAQDFRSDVAVSKANFLSGIQGCTDAGYSGQQLWDGIEIVYDDAQYVTSVSFIVDSEEVLKIDGEAFRHMFSLPSASFEIEKTQTQIIFHVSGVGHGFGMSQYAADCKAVNGETYDQILKDFFFGTELAKIE